MSRRQLGRLLEIETGLCRPDRMSWFSFGPVGPSPVVGISIGGPRRYIAFLWLPALRRDARRRRARRGREAAS